MQHGASAPRSSGKHVRPGSALYLTVLLFLAAVYLEHGNAIVTVDLIARRVPQWAFPHVPQHLTSPLKVVQAEITEEQLLRSQFRRAK